ncbi:MAG: nickel pincer cofactor biosynthesis protein LarC [candidate division WOR-3 bacterium]
MRILYLDLISGVSGDMLLSSLLSLGIPFEKWEREIRKLGLGILVKRRWVPRGHIKALSLIIRNAEKRVKKPEDFFRILERAKLKSEIKDKAKEIFSLLLKAEAKVHRTKTTHLHELGEYDTIFDIVGCLLALNLLEIKEIYASFVPLGKIKAPVTLEILKGIPVYEKDIDFEITTPTGALLIKSLVKKFCPLPLMKIERIGYGTGTFDLKEPNLLRAIVGKLEEKPKQIFLIETNVDNTSPEILGYLMEKLLKKGALDIYFTPIYCKKNRPGIKISVMTKEDKRDEMIDEIFSQTKTLGVRVYPVERYEAEREIKEIKTEYGKVRLKIGRWRGKEINLALEYEDLRKIAEEKGVPLKEVYEKLIPLTKGIY